MPTPLNILFICNKSPWPPGEGGPIAMNMLIEGLHDAGQKVKVLAVNTDKYTVNPKDIPADYRAKTGIELMYIDLSVKAVPAFANLFTSKSYHVERFVSDDFRRKLAEVLRATAFDIVQIETLYMSPYIETIRKYSKAKIVLRAHNIEHLIWQRITESTKNPFKKAYLGHLARTLRNYEAGILNSYDGIVPISEQDAGYFTENSSTPVLAVSFGINPENMETGQDLPVENALFHIGSMNWIPNEEGIRWFLDEVWPLVNANLPDLKVYLAGREMPDWLVKLKTPNVVVVGEVPDAGQFILSKTISIAPLFSGSGIRIKIIESMALGKAVVSTKVGAEGIHYTDGQNIMIADTAEDFYRTVKSLYENPSRSKEIGSNARQLILEKHDNKKIIQTLISFYREIL
ncbi:MAG: glycosyltransferase family 4 protein [Bacteroidales bacterium]|nr:glycosyltransferase family 4 protein [Bacteroidales bacterium]